MDVRQTTPSSTNDGYIIITGAAGFIASCMVSFLNNQGFTKIILVDNFGVEEKRHNWQTKVYEQIIERHSFFEWLETHQPNIRCILHLGARTDTTEFDYAVHEALNVEYSKQVWEYCTLNNIPLIYASSAATYGDGSLGYEDNHEIIESLAPLNPYGVSKNEFDKWAVKQETTPPFWAGLKFFNVYGPNEAHKGRMASVIWHSFNQINSTGLVKLFKSHREDFKDGEQLRDFIYVKDLLNVIFWMVQSYPSIPSGLYNLGTGVARSFYDLAVATFVAMDKSPNISFVDMPVDIRDKYQYFTEANMNKLKEAGYHHPFYSLEDGVDDYVRNYLRQNQYY